MAFIVKSGNTTLNIDAILTDKGRESLSNGVFNVSYFKLCDDEIDYSLYIPDSETQTAISSIPIFEGFYDTWQNLRYYLTDSITTYSIIASGLNSVLYNGQSSNIVFKLNPEISQSTFTLQLECLNNYNTIRIGGYAMTSPTMYINNYGHGNNLSITATNFINQQLKISAYSNEYDAVTVVKNITFSSAYPSGTDNVQGEV